MRKNRSFNWRRILALVLAIALLIGTLTALLTILAGCRNIENDKDSPESNGNGNTAGNALMDVIYPEVYAFDDVDKRLAIYDDYPVDQSFLDAVDDFAYRSIATLVTLNDEEGNFNYSPLSLYFALALATTGAGEGSTTEKELLGLLGMNAIVAPSSQNTSPAKLLSGQSKNLYHQLYHKNETGQLTIANSLWMDDEVNGRKINFQDDFVENAAQNFFASVYNVDFSDQENTAAIMAAWVSEHTNGLLEPNFEFDPFQLLSIINTIYFYDEWSSNPFDESLTASDIFHLADDSELEVDFMNQTLFSAAYTRGDNYTRSVRSLKNGGEMLFILPDEGISPCDLLSSAENVKTTFTGGENFVGEVIWKMPKFSFETKMRLKETLQALGVEKAFTDEADFSNITEDTQIFINDIRQETFIAVNEYGVEAAAFSQIDYAAVSMPIGYAEMILDRPFIFGITSPDGNLLFAGICENPTE